MIEALSYTFPATCLYSSHVIPGDGRPHTLLLRQVHFWDHLAVFWQPGQGEKACVYRENEKKISFFLSLDNSSTSVLTVLPLGYVQWADWEGLHHPSPKHLEAGSTPMTFIWEITMLRVSKYPGLSQHKRNHTYPALKYSAFMQNPQGAWLRALAISYIHN